MIVMRMPARDMVMMCRAFAWRRLVLGTGGVGRGAFVWLPAPRGTVFLVSFFHRPNTFLRTKVPSKVTFTEDLRSPIPRGASSGLVGAEISRTH
mgnify:CR=1 FL=1